MEGPLIGAVVAFLIKLGYDQVSAFREVRKLVNELVDLESNMSIESDLISDTSVQVYVLKVKKYKIELMKCYVRIDRQSKARQFRRANRNKEKARSIRKKLDVARLQRDAAIYMANKKFEDSVIPYSSGQYEDDDQISYLCFSRTQSEDEGLEDQFSEDEDSEDD